VGKQSDSRSPGPVVILVVVVIIIVVDVAQWRKQKAVDSFKRRQRRRTLQKPTKLCRTRQYSSSIPI
jgi:hypothetical protein